MHNYSSKAHGAGFSIVATFAAHMAQHNENREEHKNYEKPTSNLVI
jgi:hypothetical protein